MTEDSKADRESIEATRARLRALTENATFAVVTIDDASTIRFANDAVEDLFGYAPEELVGEPLFTIMPERYHEIHREAVAEYIREGTRRLDWEWIELPGLHAEGHEVPLGITFGEATVDGERRFTAVIREITDRKERERRLDLAETMFQHAKDALFLIDVDDGTFRVRRVNPAYEDATGFSSDEITGKTPREVVGDERGAAMEAHYRECVDRREPIEYEEELSIGGRTTYWETRIAPVIVDGEVEQLVGATRNITERRKREEELRETAAQLDVLFEYSPDMINVHDTDGNIIKPNPRLCEKTGYDSSELAGMKVWELDRTIDPEEAYDLWEGMGVGDRVRLEGVYERRDGSTFPVEVHVRRLGLEDDDRFIAISRDVSERKERERELERKNERLEEFAGVVSHDLRNPLNVAKGHVELARDDCDSEHLETVARAHDRMESLIEDLLTLTRAGKRVSEPEPIDLADFSRDCWRGVEATEATLVAETDRTIRADRSGLRRLLENLLRNAVEHGGEDVTITVGDLEDGFYVADDGPGIPAEDRETVLEDGYTTSFEGTGLGLAIVEELVRAHGWKLRVAESSEGGARFEISGVETVS